MGNRKTYEDNYKKESFNSKKKNSVFFEEEIELEEHTLQKQKNKQRRDNKQRDKTKYDKFQDWN